MGSDMGYKQCGIYCLKNIINGKKYIDKTKNLHRQKRELKYKNYSGRVINSALKKYGIENFEYSILTHCNENKLDYYEKFYIGRLGTKMPKGYNMTDGGDGGGDYVLTEEERVARSERNMGDKNPNFGNRWNDIKMGTSFILLKK